MNIPPLLLLAGGLVLASLIGIPVIARQADPSSMDPQTIDRPQAGRSGFDEMFLRRALESGSSEVAAAQIAVRRTTSEDIRAFAERLAREHTAVNQQLARAADTGIPDPGTGHGRSLARLEGLQGETFDQAWLAHMRKGHEQAIALYERAAREAATGELRQVAAGALPALRDHAATIESLIARYGAGTGMSSSATPEQGMRDDRWQHRGDAMGEADGAAGQTGEQDDWTPPPTGDDGRSR